MRLLFVHEAPGQFSVLHKYLNSQGLAESWLMCAQSVFNRDSNTIPNLIPFLVPKEEEKSYFYIKKIEARVKRSFYIRKAIIDFLEKHKIDLIIAHGSGGFPLQLFDEFDIPIITYIEFPSFSSHGYDEKYPQPEYARYVDKLFEMSSYHQVIKSELVIVPSHYAKTMFPDYLHHKIIPQMEGFDIVRSKASYNKKEGVHYIGYASRDLSSAKGFEQFIIIAKEILKVRQDVKFVFCGSPKVLYSYEGEMLQKHYGQGHKKTFMDYILEREKIELGVDSNFEHVEFSAYNEFASFIESMDLFIYPLQYGSANWGLFELLFRARIVIASDRCFIPEVIKHGFNGFLCKYEDIQGWVVKVCEVLDNYGESSAISRNVVEDAKDKYSIEKVAKNYLSIFDVAIAKSKVSRALKNSIG